MCVGINGSRELACAVVDKPVSHCPGEFTRMYTVLALGLCEVELGRRAGPHPDRSQAM